jgi:hypothetical protein
LESGNTLDVVVVVVVVVVVAGWKPLTASFYCGNQVT